MGFATYKEYGLMTLMDSKSAGFALLALAVIGLAPLAGLAGDNLVVNGSFDNPTNALQGWKTKYDLPGESWYAENDKHVSVVEHDGSQKKVLALWGDVAILQVPGQGTQADSDPIPYTPGSHYHFSALARSTGPNCRILVEGYRWRPGIKPHPQPALHELRKCYRFSQLYYGEEQTGTKGAVGPNWKRASTTFPEKKTTKLQQSMLDAIQFLVVHIIAIDGSEGYLYVDDVKIEKLP
jgi:hypothetical protein